MKLKGEIMGLEAQGIKRIDSSEQLKKESSRIMDFVHHNGADVYTENNHDALMKKYVQLVADSKATCTVESTGEKKEMFCFTHEQMKELEGILFWYKNEYKELDSAFDALIEAYNEDVTFPVVTRILKSGDRTIVFWEDGTKTIVKRAADEEESEYAAFTAAFTKKSLGCNSFIRKMLKRVTEYQEVRKK